MSSQQNNESEVSGVWQKKPGKLGKFEKVDSKKLREKIREKAPAVRQELKGETSDSQMEIPAGNDK